VSGVFAADLMPVMWRQPPVPKLQVFKSALASPPAAHPLVTSVGKSMRVPDHCNNNSAKRHLNLRSNDRQKKRQRIQRMLFARPSLVPPCQCTQCSCTISAGWHGIALLR
jgi:hypothetical protein